MGPRRPNPKGTGGLRSHRSSLLLAVALLRLVVVPTLSLARPLCATHCLLQQASREESETDADVDGGDPASQEPPLHIPEPGLAE